MFQAKAFHQELVGDKTKFDVFELRDFTQNK